MLGGTVFHCARILSGKPPRWEVVALMLGLGIGMAIYARQNHLLAKAADRFSSMGDEGQESGA
jgi:hypothetical protein